MNPAKFIHSKHQNLTSLRRQIDKVDGQIVELLAQRQKLVVQVARVKKRQHLPITQVVREKQLLASKRKLAKLHSLNPNFVVRLFKLIITESRQLQAKVSRGANL